MEEKYERISRFLTACDELVDGTYMGAERRVSQVLKTLAESKDLTGLFSAVTQEFDYQAAKARCLRAPEGKRASAYLPTGRVEALAFVFCLLAEIDSGKIHFSDFLLRYFYVDGSYTASWSVFSERMLKPFRDIVREAYPACAGPLVREQSIRDERLGLLSGKIAEERARIAKLPLSQEDRIAGDVILSAVHAATGRQDVTETLALLAGYRYFLRCIGGDCALTRQIFDICAEL